MQPETPLRPVSDMHEHEPADYEAVGVSDADPWQLMDAWCVKQSSTLAERVAPHIRRGRSLDDPEYRRLLGQHQAFGRMRSFIHGSRNAQGGEARRAETGTGSVHDHPVGAADAPHPSPEPTHD